MDVQSGCKRDGLAAFRKKVAFVLEARIAAACLLSNVIDDNNEPVNNIGELKR